MKKYSFLFLAFLTLSCTDFGQLKVVAELPSILEEASGIQQIKGSDLLWMLNDSGNSSTLFGLTVKGKIKKQLKINALNYDWEDLTVDTEGNMYIADFGNNRNNRKDLVIYKVNHKDLHGNKDVEVERIAFSYPEQKAFPPNKKRYFFDAESLFWKNDSLYIFTKSRVRGNPGVTSLYKIAALPGTYQAEFVSEFKTCDKGGCWVTSADISPNGKKVVLLNHDAVWLFTDFNGNDFFSGKSKRLPFDHTSQKESVCFKNDSTLYITDERSGIKGGYLYEFSLD